MAATDRKKTGNKSILPQTKEQIVLEAINKNAAKTKASTEADLAELKRTTALFIERRVMDDIDRFIPEVFTSAALGVVKLLCCSNSKFLPYFCRYYEAEAVTSVSGSVHVRLESVSPLNGVTVVSVCATWDMAEFCWNKDRTRWTIKTRITEAIERLQKEHERYFTEAAVKIVKEEHEKAEKAKADAQTDPV